MVSERKEEREIGNRRKWRLKTSTNCPFTEQWGESKQIKNTGGTDLVRRKEAE